MSQLFFSYSHSDEGMRNELEKHLSMLKRQGLVETFHDRKILAGDDFSSSIDEQIRRAYIILLLVSSDFINSNYCYGIEMNIAMERHNRGEARVIPVILRSCDWMHPPLNTLLAVPTDGKPIAVWSNSDEGYLDAVNQIRGVIAPPEPSVIRPRPSALDQAVNAHRSRNLVLPRSITDAEIDRFIEESFDYMTQFFENSLGEVHRQNNGFDANFRRIDADNFIATIYGDRGRSSRCKISLNQSFGKGISFSFEVGAISNSINEILRVENIDGHLKFKPMMDLRHHRKNDCFGCVEAAEFYWSLLTKGLQ